MQTRKKRFFLFRMIALVLMFLLPAGLDLAARAGLPWLVWTFLGISAGVAALLVRVR